MQRFEFRVQGLGVKPILLFVTTRNEASAKAMAQRMHMRTEGGAHIDVWQGDRYLFTVGQPPPVQPKCPDTGNCGAVASI